MRIQPRPFLSWIFALIIFTYCNSPEKKEKSDQRPKNAEEKFYQTKTTFVLQKENLKITADKFSWGQGINDTVALSYFYSSPETVGTSTLFYPFYVQPGKQYLIRLNGNNVFLNAATIFCTSEAAKKMNHFMVLGEAFFEANGKTDSIVIESMDAHGMKITAKRGSRLNVKNYSDESENIVSLIKGSANIELGKRKIILNKPGDELVMDNSEKIEKRKCDTIQVMAWTKGMMICDGNLNVYSAFRELSRWYNKRLVYTDTIHPFEAKYTFTYRDKSFQSLSELWKEAFNIECKVNGDNMYVSKGKY